MKKFYTLLLLIAANFIFQTSYAQPAGWTSVQVFTVTNPGSSVLTNYQLKLTINTAALVSTNQMQASGADIRFGSDCAGTTIYPHFIDSGMNSITTIIWVKIDNLPASGNKTIYMYHGNTTATNTSTFSVFNGPFSSTNQVTPPNTNTVSNCQRGFRFSPNETILVSEFGKRAPDATTRYVTLFNYTTQAILRQMQVTGAAATYTYQNLSNHIWLNQSQQYVLELFNGSGDQYYYGGTGQVATQLTFHDMLYCNNCTQNTFPTTSLPNIQYGVPDFRFYTKNNATPAPTYTLGGSSSSATITSHPANQSACTNSATSISVTTSPVLTTGLQWQINTGTGWNNLTNTAPYSGVTSNVLNISNVTTGLNGYQYRVVVPGGCGSSSTGTNSNPGTLTVVNTTGVPTANISVSPANTGCINGTYTFTANITNGSPTPNYQWKRNGNNVGNNSATYVASGLSSGDVITMQLSTTYPCVNPPSATSNSITMTLANPVVPAVTMSASPVVTNICSGLPITFTAVPVNGGSTPTYQWQINGNNVGTNSSTFTSTTLGNNDIVTVIMTSSNNCVTKASDTSNAIAYTVSQSVEPDITIQSDKPGNVSCKGEVVHFTTGLVNQGNAPVLSWLVNGVPVGNSNLDYYNSTLNNGDIVTCRLQSNIMCRTKDYDTSNAVIMSIVPPPTPVVTKTANVLSTTTYSSYQWIKDGLLLNGANSQTYTVSAPGNYWVRVQNGSCEGESAPLWVPYILGLNQVQNKDLKLYPNPTADGLHVQYKDAVNVVLRNVIGQIIFQQKNCDFIPMDKLADGYYLVEVSDKTGLIGQEKIQKIAR